MLHFESINKVYFFIFILLFFFLSGFSFTDTDDSQDSRGKEVTIFYSTLPLPLVHEHSDIYLQLWIFILKKMRKPKVEFEDLFQYTSFILLIEKLEILFQYISYDPRIQEK